MNLWNQDVELLEIKSMGWIHCSHGGGSFGYGCEIWQWYWDGECFSFDWQDAQLLRIWWGLVWSQKMSHFLVLAWWDS